MMTQAQEKLVHKQLLVGLLLMLPVVVNAAFCPKHSAFAIAADPEERWVASDKPGWRSTYKSTEYNSQTLVRFSSAVAYGGDSDFPYLAACVYALSSGDVVAMEPRLDNMIVNRTTPSSGTWSPVKDYGENHILYICKEDRRSCKFLLPGE